MKHLCAYCVSEMRHFGSAAVRPVYQDITRPEPFENDRSMIQWCASGQSIMLPTTEVLTPLAVTTVNGTMVCPVHTFGALNHGGRHA